MLWDLSGSLPDKDKPSLRWVDKFKCKNCGTKVKDGEIKRKNKRNNLGEWDNEQSDNRQKESLD